jgi:hypothetical protein
MNEINTTTRIISPTPNMKKYTLQIAAFICTFFTNARQPCNAENVHSLMGTWKNTSPDFKNGIWDFYCGAMDGTTLFTQDILAVEEINHVYRFIARPGIAPIIVIGKKEYFSNWIKKLQFEVTENDKQVKKISNSKAPYLPLPFLRDCRQFFAARPLSSSTADTQSGALKHW